MSNTSSVRASCFIKRAVLRLDQIHNGGTWKYFIDDREVRLSSTENFIFAE